jgi:pimeloyl-ACP methyl ester carboxylesterase
MVVVYVITPPLGTTPEQLQRQMREAYANAKTARLVTIENALHFIQLDQPARLVAEIEAMMAAR